MFEDGISIPGLTLKHMFQDLLEYFTLPEECNKDLQYTLSKNNIVGGPSTVFFTIRKARPSYEQK